MYALNLGEDGRVLSVTLEKYGGKNDPLVENFPEDDLSNYRYADEEFIYDPLPVEEVEEVPGLEEQVAELREALDLLLSGVTE